jgi:hypothetical protein
VTCSIRIGTIISDTSQNMKDQNKMEIEKNFRFRNLLLLAILGQMEINLRGLVLCKLDLVLAINCIKFYGIPHILYRLYR